MARHVYSSFHYDDIWRANVVRKSNTLKTTATEVGFYDHSLWEEAKTKGKPAVKRLIDQGMAGAGVTVVLIGAKTYSRPWVIYEIEKSHADEMGLLAIHINGIKDQAGYTKSWGTNPLDYVSTPGGVLGPRRLSSVYKTYDWTQNNGYSNVGTWIEAAARAAGR